MPERLHGDFTKALMSGFELEEILYLIQNCTKDVLQELETVIADDQIRQFSLQDVFDEIALELGNRLQQSALKMEKDKYLETDREALFSLGSNILKCFPDDFKSIIPHPPGDDGIEGIRFE